MTGCCAAPASVGAVVVGAPGCVYRLDTRAKQRLESRHQQWEAPSHTGGHVPDTKAQLMAELEKVSASIRDDTQARDRLMRELRDIGVSYRVLGELAGLNHQTIANRLRTTNQEDQT